MSLGGSKAHCGDQPNRYPFPEPTKLQELRYNLPKLRLPRKGLTVRSVTQDGAASIH